MQKILRMLISRTSFIVFLLLLQIALFFVLIEYIYSKIAYINMIFYAVSVIIVIYLVYKEENPVYKLAWIVPILIFPLFGGLFYIFYRERNIGKKTIKKYEESEIERHQLTQGVLHNKLSKISSYLNHNYWPTYQNSKTSFLASGEILFADLKQTLLAAKKYIFLEFFIINPGKMWDEILEILLAKVAEDVEVFLLYDDFGSSKLPFHYDKKLQKLGIQAYAFNKMRIHLNFAMNYRDHRKVVIVDGNKAYTGGINIGDEYINLTHPYGHWQDAGIKIEGDAVWPLVINYLNTIQFATSRHIDILKYKGDLIFDNQQNHVAPYADAPIDKELTTKNIYLTLISQAQKEILISTPYLILDNEIATALKIAAKSGVDVKIVIPHIPDKKLVFMVTESYASELMQSGVKVYRYKPGFIHSKMVISDRKEASIGTSNFDFRSLYLHFENNVYLRNDDSIADMGNFFDNILNDCILVTDVKKRNIFYRILQVLIRGFGILM